MTAALEGGEWSAARPGRTLPPGKNRYPLYRRLGGPQGRSGRAQNLGPTGIGSRTAHPVVSRYTDWAIRVHGNDLIKFPPLFHLSCMKVNRHSSGTDVIKVGHWASLSAFFHHSFSFAYFLCLRSCGHWRPRKTPLLNITSCTVLTWSRRDGRCSYQECK